MDMDTRNGIAELVLESLKEPEKAKYIDILESYCQHVEKWKNLIVPLKSLNGSISRKDIDPLLHSHLFKMYPLDNSYKNHEHEKSPLSSETILCLDPDIEEDFLYISQRVHAGYRIIQHLRENPIPKNKNHIEDGVIKASLLFNNKLYFETHEILEEIWLEEVGSVRPFLQGIIQVAVGFHHLLNRNYVGAVNLSRDGADKLRPFAPVSYGLDVKSFLEGVDRCQEMLNKLNRESVDQFDFSLIPDMKIVEKG